MMETTIPAAPCPICKEESDHTKVTHHSRGVQVECPRCGKFLMTGSAQAVAKNRVFDPRVSAWVRGRSEDGELVEINSQILDGLESTLPAYRVSAKQLLLLKSLERRTTRPGDAVLIVPEYDYGLAWATTPGELVYLLESLLERKLIARADGSFWEDQSASKQRPISGELAGQFSITAEGWDHIESNSKASCISTQVFVAMSFSDELKSAWRLGIEPGVSTCGWSPYRVDSRPHADRIDTKIMSEIKNSRFLVADVTGQKAGVYFEAGYALGLSIPVIWSVRADELDKVHFDTRQYNHIVWKSEGDLKKSLHHYINAIVGKGPGPKEDLPD